MQFYKGGPNHGGIVRMFGQAPNVSGDTTLEIIWQNIDKIVAIIVDAVKGIIAVVELDTDAMAASVESVEKDAKSLLEKINNSGNVRNGIHMNGFFSRWAKDPGIRTLVELDKKWSSQTGSDAAKVTEILRRTFRAIERLPEDGHYPWLRAEWQVDFQAILQGASIALGALVRGSRLSA